MKLQPIGYIVLNKGFPLALNFGKGYAPRGSLIRGDAATVFKMRSRARSAINRTIVWEEKECAAAGLPLWDWAQKWRFKIMPVMEAQ